MTLLLLVLAGGSAARADVLALCYHDIHETQAAALHDPYGVSVDELVKQFNWLKGNGFTPITLGAYQAATSASELPPKPVILTFDDGYASFYEHAFPLLKLYGFPSVLAPVTNWIDQPEGTVHPVSGVRYLSWHQLRDIRDSGLVELATHTHALHTGVLSNPYGNTQPAAVTRQYWEEAEEYESDANYRQRIRQDLQGSLFRFEAELGLTPNTVVWPYGAHNQQITEIAFDLGLVTHATLLDKKNVPGSRALHRQLVGSSMTLSEFATTVEQISSPDFLRIVSLDPMALVEDQMNWSENFGNFVEHIDQLNVNTAVVDALYETRSGAFQALFKGSKLPVQQDVFGRIAWQLRTRADVEVFARLPVSKENAPGLAALVDQLGVISHLNGLVLDVTDMESFAEYRDDIYARLQSRRPGSKLLIQIDEALFAQQSRRMLNELAGRVDYVLVTVSNAASKRQLRRLVRSLVKNDRVEKFAVILQESGRRSSAVVPDLSRSTALLAELQEQGLVHVGYEPPAGLLIKQSLRQVSTQLSANQYPARR